MTTIRTLALVTLALIPAFAHANRESGSRGGRSAIYVNFSSIGEGIDGRSLELYDRLVAEAESREEVLQKTREQKGREGETFVCVEFETAFVRHAFMQAFAPSILADRQAKGYERTTVLAAARCGHPEEASKQELNGYGK